MPIFVLKVIILLAIIQKKTKLLLQAKSLSLPFHPMKIYESTTLNIELIAQEAVLFYQWTAESQDLSQTEFVKEAQIIHDEIVKHNIKYILADDRNFLFPIVPALQELIAKQLLSTLNIIGVKKFAHVVSPDIITQLSVEQLFEENQSATYKDQYFNIVEDALIWLQTAAPNE